MHRRWCGPAPSLGQTTGGSASRERLSQQGRCAGSICTQRNAIMRAFPRWPPLRGRAWRGSVLYILLLLIIRGLGSGDVLVIFVYIIKLLRYHRFSNPHTCFIGLEGVTRIRTRIRTYSLYFYFYSAVHPLFCPHILRRSPAQLFVLFCFVLFLIPWLSIYIFQVLFQHNLQQKFVRISLFFFTLARQLTCLAWTTAKAWCSSSITNFD